ncbi:alcohol dehydrogenase catalytic domain-containing protein [Frankia sp. CNm7]|uniref:Alcohol dehydrogenase catalytic domain-containing protein n=1 Tax=Frankia nepalensis TaxID=1836974 RepID=A0A937UUE7_9ACTN|nr:alcohol dehydrogenase catalytic domain-containing protein [Frankia nepalensis]MBL7498248.1 alcohol dehydrogenase catalytic domain-containing protein [Frankia nepalensis]MBL7509544.1 alcohol dehydrogenase catalytic domain-containing protein [Frankia nepalensis]MBL7524080.1 alcohol dehydrogenase catalytic domain-containing protein [Frankia nepalensis]MBL7632175.1 alcohol dehydrogenase catalytic domain-containing protein [Frankia nepalensis]
MRATFMYGPGDVRVENVPGPTIVEPTDAIVRITLACVCGSDLHPYRSMDKTDQGVPMGHEFLGVVEDTGSDVRGPRRGDFVVSPFAFADNTCPICRDGFHTACPHGGWYGAGGVGGAQAEAVRVPQADGTLVKIPTDVDTALLPSLLALSDVYLTGYHAAHMGRVEPGKTVTVIGDGAVGLSAVLASRRMGAEKIILMGRHASRTDLGREWGATDVVAERGEEGVATVMELTGGEGSHVVLEAVGLMPAYEQAYGIVRPGGIISRVGVPQYEQAPVGFGSLFGKNAQLAGGPAPVRAYLEPALEDVLAGRIDPGRVFDAEVALDEVADAYRAMDERSRLKVLVRP